MNRILFYLLLLHTSFVVAQPSLWYPPNNAVDMRLKTFVQFSYNVTDQTEYQVDTTNKFNSTLFQTGKTVTAAGFLNVLRFNTKYYWRARIIYKSNGDSSAWSAINTFTTIDSFEVTTPTLNDVNQAVNININFKATGTANRIVIDTTAAFDSPIKIDTLVIDSIGQGSASYPLINSFQLNALYFGKKYFLKALMYNTKDSSAWSKTFSFTTFATVPLTTPSNTGTFPVDLTPSFTKVTDNYSDTTVLYTCEMDTSNGFNSPYKVSFSKKYPDVSQKVLLHYGKKYFIRARAAHKRDTSAWSKVPAFFSTYGTPGSGLGFLYPSLSLPDTAIMTDSVRFVMYNLSEAKRVECRIDTVNSFNSPLLKTDTMTLAFSSGVFVIRNLYFGKNYFVSVRAISDVDTSSWYTRRYSTIKKVKPLLPANNDTYQSTNPELSWTLLKNQSGFICQLDTSPAFNSATLVTMDSSTTSNKCATPDLRYDEKYYWRVKIRSAYDTSTWSNVFNFRTSPYAIYINTPYQDQINIAVNPTRFDWDQPSGMRGYNYQVDKDSLFSNPINRYVTDVSKSYDDLNGLDYGSKYFFRLRGYNKVDTTDWYYLRRFFTVAEPATPATPVLTTPLDQSTNQVLTNLSLNWNAALNCSSYELQLSQTSDFSNPVVYTTAGLLYFIPTLKASTTYYWRVRGVNDVKRSGWTVAFSFTTMDLPLTPTGLSPDNLQSVYNKIVNFTWDAVPNSQGYQFVYSSDPGFAGAVPSSTVPNAFTLYNLGVNKYYWKVRSILGAYTSEWSATATFKAALVGLDEMNGEDHLLVYPNPTHGLIKLKNNLIEQPVKAVVYDTFGKDVYHINDLRIETNLSQLPHGLYVLQMQTNAGVKLIRLVID